MPDHFACEKQTFGARTYCGRCDIVSEESELVCKSPAECGLTLSFIRIALDDEARRIDGSNEAAHALSEQMIGEGYKVTPGPFPDRVRRAAALRAAVRLIDRIDADREIKGLLRKGEK